MNNAEVGKRIRELREDRIMTRDELAYVIGVTPKFLYEIELGKKGFSAKTLIKLSRALSVSCEFIMLGVNDNKSKKLQGLMYTLKQFDDDQIPKVAKIIRGLRDISTK